MERKRRWFQIHLSTALVLMCLAGAFVGLNVLPNYSLSSSKRPHAIAAYGWPILLLSESTATHRRPLFYRCEFFHNAFSNYIGAGFFAAAALNLASAITVMLGVVLIIENRILRRAAPTLGKHRRWYQIHLSTAIVMVIATSAMLWANITVRNSMNYNETEWFGWPINCAVNNKFGFIFVWGGLIDNILICGLCLLAVGTTCELILRRLNK